MAPQRRARLEEELKRRLVPMVAVQMSQHNGGDVVPGQLGVIEEADEFARTDAEIDQDAATIDIEIAGVARAAAGQNDIASRHGYPFPGANDCLPFRARWFAAMGLLSPRVTIERET